jgi:hypothetical protein
VIAARLLTSALRWMVFTSKSKHAPSVKPNVRVTEAKWNQLLSDFKLKPNDLPTEGMPLDAEWRQLLGPDIDTVNDISDHCIDLGELGLPRHVAEFGGSLRWIVIKFLLVSVGNLHLYTLSVTGFGG